MNFHYAQVEFTTHCNLKCVYCAVSKPFWKPQTLTIDDYSALLDQFKILNVKIITLNGHGETTILPEWMNYAIKALERGFQLAICSNLAKSYSRDELLTLSKFFAITVSLDTIEPKLFAELRKGGDVRNVLFNMTRIQALSNGAGPEFMWSCVLSDRTIDGLIEYLEHGVSLGVRKFCLCNLGPPGDVSLRHLATLPKAEASRALAIIDTAVAYGLAQNVVVDVKPGLYDSLKRVVHGISN